MEWRRNLFPAADRLAGRHIYVGTASCEMCDRGSSCQIRSGVDASMVYTQEHRSGETVVCTVAGMYSWKARKGGNRGRGYCCIISCDIDNIVNACLRGPRNYFDSIIECEITRKCVELLLLVIYVPYEKGPPFEKLRSTYVVPSVDTF